MPSESTGRLLPTNGVRDVAQLDDDHAINSAEVKMMLGVSHAKLDTLQKRDDFPKPFKFTHRRLWTKGEIRAFRESMRASTEAA